MNVVICHWVTVVAATEAGAEGLVVLIQDMAVYFYVDSRLVASTQPERLLRVFGVLTYLFDRCSLQINTRNTGEHGMSSMPHAWKDFGGGV